MWCLLRNIHTNIGIKLIIVGGFNNWTEKDCEKDMEMNNLNVDEEPEVDDDSKFREILSNQLEFVCCLWWPELNYIDNSDRAVRSASASPEKQRKNPRFLSSQISQPGGRGRKVSYKDETLKYREHNLFSRKVPKNAEAVNIEVSFSSSHHFSSQMTPGSHYQVATCDFLQKPVFAFIRLRNPIMLEDFCEINKPTR